MQLNGRNNSQFVLYDAVLESSGHNIYLVQRLLDVCKGKTRHILERS